MCQSFHIFFYIVTLCDTFVVNWVSSFHSLRVLFLSGSFIVSMGTTLYTTESLHCTALCCRCAVLVKYGDRRHTDFNQLVKIFSQKSLLIYLFIFIY